MEIIMKKEKFIVTSLMQEAEDIKKIMHLPLYADLIGWHELRLREIKELLKALKWEKVGESLPFLGPSPREFF